ncbi:MAG: hypothetical protein JNK82_06185 [Myxococcaceae bacterium]|nr:hypothetical protein [Myxococcaceae bacterium]
MRPAAVVALLLLSCAAREAGIEVEVRARVVQPLAMSYAVATVAIERLELVPCPEAGLWRRLSPISSAWAHGSHSESETGPRVIHAPLLVDLRGEAPQPLAVMRPPPGTYCQLVVTFSPSGSDGPAAGATLVVTPQRSTRTVVAPVQLPPLTLDARHLAHTLTLQLQPHVEADADATLDGLVASLRLQPKW